MNQSDLHASTYSVIFSYICKLIHIIIFSVLTKYSFRFRINRLQIVLFKVDDTNLVGNFMFLIFLYRFQNSYRKRFWTTKEHMFRYFL